MESLRLGKKALIDKVTWARFVRAVKRFASAEFGWKAKLMFTMLITLMFSINGLNAVNNYAGRPVVARAR